MTKHTSNDKSGDNDELEALFNSIVSQQEEAATAAPAEEETLSEEAMMAAMMGESPSAPSSSAAASPPTSVSPSTEEERGDAIFQSIGLLTRQLHDTLHELGYDKSMERLATELPDARDRLNYVAKMTEQAAERVLNATDQAQPLQNALSATSIELKKSWNDLLNNPSTTQEGAEQLKALVERTQQFLGDVSDHTEQTNKYLMDIVMAQDFQDLTGQVIKKIITAAADLETRLVAILVQYTPEDKREELDLLHGPQVTTEGKTDIVTDQQQVDDLLASLGF